MREHNPFDHPPSPNHMQQPAENTLRMIDANLNRASEGLRVLEDVARFVIDNRQLSQRIKACRHDLKSGIDGLQLRHDALVLSRNTAGDVGTSIKTEQEMARTHGLHDVLRAAAKRTGEALRVIEESAKTFTTQGAIFESVRYRVYDIERDLLIATHPPCPQWKLCVLITAHLCTHHTPTEIISLAHAGGADCIQIREKTMPDGLLLDHAGSLTRHAHTLGMHVMINDRPHIAKLVDADGVHLGLDDVPTSAARSLLGPTKWIGRTCPTIEHAKAAIEEGADTCGLGPVFPSTTKSKPELAGLDLIRSYLSDSQTRSSPMLAISGISPTNIHELAAIGCPGVAVSSAVCSNTDPQAAAASIVSAINPHSETSAPTIKA